jgi:hypothetical protein
MEKKKKMSEVEPKSQNEKDEITALIKKTDKENPKPEDVKALRKLLKTEKNFSAMSEISRTKFFKAFSGKQLKALWLSKNVPKCISKK